MTNSDGDDVTDWNRERIDEVNEVLTKRIAALTKLIAILLLDRSVTVEIPNPKDRWSPLEKCGYLAGADSYGRFIVNLLDNSQVQVDPEDIKCLN